MIWVQSLTFLFFKISFCNVLLQLFVSSRIITASTTVVLFCFQGQLWGGFPSTKSFLLSIASSEVLIQKRSLMKFSFKIAVLHIFRKFQEKDQQVSSCSTYLWAFNMRSMTNDFLGISQKCSKQFFKELFSWQEASDFVWLFLKIFQKTFQHFSSIW